MQLELETMLLWVVHKARPLQGPERGWLRCRQGGGGVGCMRPSATQYPISLLAVLACSYTAFLISPTLTALAVLSGPLRTGTEPANTSNEGIFGSLYQRSWGGSVAEWLACWTQAQKGLC